MSGNVSCLHTQHIRPKVYGIYYDYPNQMDLTDVVGLPKPMDGKMTQIFSSLQKQPDPPDGGVVVGTVHCYVFSLYNSDI